MTDLWGAALEAAAAREFQPGNLEAKFVAPPFSVLDTRQGYWQERRRSWLSLGIQSELGRSGKLISQATERKGMGGDYDTTKGENAWGGAGTSIFDPVLAELAYRWWAPEGGRVLDPFAGGSVRGIVAGKLGHPYTGIELRAEQVEANRAQALQLLGADPTTEWIIGDTVQVLPTLEAEAYDMVLTCPPYFDLEVYSDDPADLSNVTWGQFVELYAEAMAGSARALRPERFSVWVVSEVRDEAGYCRGLVPLTVQVAEQAGLRLYNEAVLVNAVGSLPIRVTKYMEASRKLGRVHQNVLCFVKGKPPRGWSWEREAPPSPQLSLFEEATPAPEERAAVALVAKEDIEDATDEATRAAVLEALREAVQHLEEGTAEWVADVEGMPEPEPWQLERDGDLSPVEEHELAGGGRVWLKRDDLFEVAGVRGGKARSCWRLAQGATGLVTAGSRSSPQANIVAQVAAELGIPARLHMPAGEPTPEQELALAAGAAIVPHRPGHNSVIVARAREDAAARGWREIPFGMECQEAVDATAEQVANLPAEATRVVVPVGSGMSLAGVLRGLERAGRTDLPVVGVQVGADPTRRLLRWAPEHWQANVELVPSGSDYHTPQLEHPVLGVELDAHYEAKAALHLQPGDVLWCVGIRQSQVQPDPDSGPAQPVPRQDAEEPPEPVHDGAEPEPAAPGPLSAGEPPAEPVSWAEPNGEALRQLEDGRYVDTGTGEILEPTLAVVSAGSSEVLLRPSGRLPVVSATRAPMPLEEWHQRRGREWNPGDPHRPCWECGRPPAGRFKDGSPSYDHSHNPQVLAMFDAGQVAPSQG